MNGLLSRFSYIDILHWTFPCRPKILIVSDSAINFNSFDGFGVTRFIEAITLHSGVTTKPELTLAYREPSHSPSASVAIGTDTYTVLEGYVFDHATTGVTLARYDQVWIFGFTGGGFTLSVGEVAALSAFMNGGGGVFATGDHATLGKALSGELPRIRHMRDWSNVPMGTEVPSIAVERVDTIVDPGANNQYDFNDQSDAIPQRIYPNYKVTGTTSSNWQATIHPLLGPANVRNSNIGFGNDIDVLPDHAHESVCFETPTAVLPGMYNLHGQNFEEFRPSANDVTVRIGSEIVAYGVSGGRSVLNGVWKPPVRPRMFGLISAYDGRLAQPYSGTVRPGRVVCDSTWHHFVNINLDGTGAGTTGLGTGSGASFVPGPALLKIYEYYRRIVAWLQPANRVLCSWIWTVYEVRYNLMIVEELEGLPSSVTWDDMVAIGRTAERVLETQGESLGTGETLAAVLTAAGHPASGELFATRKFQDTRVDTSELGQGLLGAAVIRAGELLPVGNAKKAAEVLSRGAEKNAKELLAVTLRALKTGLDAQTRCAEQIAVVCGSKSLRKGL
jgi:hypothetical protein